jgi:hypothetical protein
VPISVVACGRGMWFDGGGVGCQERDAADGAVAMRFSEKLGTFRGHNTTERRHQPYGTLLNGFMVLVFQTLVLGGMGTHFSW